MKENQNYDNQPITLEMSQQLLKGKYRVLINSYLKVIEENLEDIGKNSEKYYPITEKIVKLIHEAGLHLNKTNLTELGIETLNRLEKIGVEI